MPTREEIANVIAEYNYGKNFKPFRRDYECADAILALPSPAPVGEAALLARAETAEAALSGIRERCLQEDGRWMEDCIAECEDMARRVLFPESAAHQTAAAEAREEGPMFPSFWVEPK